jgi:hypothetical protein
MCFYVTEENPNERTANRDITCYKAVNKIRRYRVKRFVAEFMYFIYHAGRTYKLSKPLRVTRGWGGLRKIAKGFHSYTSIEEIKSLVAGADISIVKCIIPKGSKYYWSRSEKEYVSDTIKIIDEI